MHKTLNSWLCSPNITRIRRRVCLLLGRRVTRGNSSVGRVTRGNGTRRRVGSGCWVHTSWTTGVNTSWSTGVRWGGWIASWREAEGKMGNVAPSSYISRAQFKNALRFPLLVTVSKFSPSLHTLYLESPNPKNNLELGNLI